MRKREGGRTDGRTGGRRAHEERIQARTHERANALGPYALWTDGRTDERREGADGFVRKPPTACYLPDLDPRYIRD